MHDIVLTAIDDWKLDELAAAYTTGTFMPQRHRPTAKSTEAFRVTGRGVIHPQHDHRIVRFPDGHNCTVEGEHLHLQAQPVLIAADPVPDSVRLEVAIDEVLVVDGRHWTVTPRRMADPVLWPRHDLDEARAAAAETGGGDVDRP